jgi:hypothetical protein
MSHEPHNQSNVLPTAVGLLLCTYDNTPFQVTGKLSETRQIGNASAKSIAFAF